MVESQRRNLSEKSQTPKRNTQQEKTQQKRRPSITLESLNASEICLQERILKPHYVGQKKKVQRKKRR